MGKQSLTAALALVSLTAALAACGTPAPAPNNSHNKGGTGTTHKSAQAGAKKNTKSGSGAKTGNSSGGNKGAASTGKATGHKGTTSGTSAAQNKKVSGTGAANATGTAIGTAATKPISLKTLPSITSLDPYNPHHAAYHEVSAFINEMGYHWATQVPGIVYMTNNHNQVTAVEAQFPQNHGTFGWYDPPTPPTILNASLAWHSEHLYFVAPNSITTGMSATLPSDLTSWNAFKAVNTRLNLYVKEPKTYHGYTVYAPPNGPGIKVLVSPSGPIAGFLVGEPAMWGWSPVYLQSNGKPVHSLAYGTAYQSAFMLGPSKAPAASAGTTTK
ncbi:hypothetical protein [Sulfobacillus harzensis]|uniref:Uncharacterized protein n=1 Tax=Sulfobacillus harzensis TaxID=2729629 RepID=A0A7Y0Q5P7_9FIRM|nr:hypothetical protein [Sulfobacillus harzensis]NMP24529.1 hypothetical protein [Sulfobacillus harzensis]